MSCPLPVPVACTVFAGVYLYLCLCPSLSCQAASPEAKTETVTQAFEKNVLPLLEENCFDCHGEKSPKGGVNLEHLQKPETVQRRDIRLWDKVREQLRARTMPPPKKGEITQADSAAITTWIRQNEQATRLQIVTDPGPPRTRRMNREEYSNTLRDLLGVQQRYGELFPTDGSGGEGFTNSADTLIISPLLIESYFTAAEKAIAEVWSRDGVRQHLAAPALHGTMPPDDAARIPLQSFLRRAYRRPPADADIDDLLNVFRAARKHGLSWDACMQSMFTAALISPKFIFLEDAASKPADKPHPLTSHEMATRLSYFLWASMPDEPLFALADKNTLQDPNVLATQVKRMLADKKAAAFTKNFAGHWLGFEEFPAAANPDEGKFKEFTSELRAAMYDEVFQFSDHLLRQNGRVLDFLDSSYSYLNEPLAGLYGVPGVKGEGFRRVNFPDKRRGGLTGMAAILTYTSYPQRTSAVKRGKWVLEQLLGTPPPPPPPNVGQLSNDPKTVQEKTLRQRLEEHRSKAACAGCHTRLDPPGFGLENFDPIGRWRDLDEKQKPIDASSEMPGGRPFNGPEQFRQQLLQDKDLFTRNLCFKLLGYSLNRSLEITDQPVVLQLEEVLRQNDHRSEALIIAVVQSYPFRWRN